MTQWIYFIHAPRERFAETMTDEEQAVWGEHVQLLTQRLAEGSLILAGPTLGPINTGVCVFEAPDEDAALAYMNEDPTIASGIEAQMLDKPGGIFVRRADQLSPEDHTLLQAAARMVFSDDNGNLAEQLQRRPRGEVLIPPLAVERVR